MNTRKCTAVVVTLVVLLTPGLPASAGPATSSDRILVPSGTPIYLELPEKIVSKRKVFPVGTVINASVWRDVIVEGEVVIPEGASIKATITEVVPRRPVGLPGRLRIVATSLTLNDGRNVALEDGYAAQGANAMGSAIVLALFVALPLIFIPGENVVLEQGAVLQAFTGENFEVASAGRLRSDHSASEESAFSARIRVDALASRKRLKRLPMDVTICGGTPELLRIDNVNGRALRKKLRLKVMGETATGDHCRTLDVRTPKRLRKRFRRGINYFEVTYDAVGQRLATEVILEREL